MLVRHVVAVMLVAALGGANAMALPLEAGVQTDLPWSGLTGAPAVEAELTTPAAPAIDTDLPALRSDPSAVQEALRGVAAIAGCVPAVEVPLTLWGGRVTAERGEDGTFRLIDTQIIDIYTTMVPQFRTVEKVVWQPSGLLSFLPPVTKALLVEDGMREVTRYVTETIEVAVEADWTARYIEWEATPMTILLTLGAGAPFLPQAPVVLACDGDVVLPSLPSFDDRGYDVVDIDVFGRDAKEDGWIADILTLEVRPATAADRLALPLRSGTLWCPGEVSQAIDSGVSELAGTGTIEDVGDPSETEPSPPSEESRVTSKATSKAGPSSPLVWVGVGLAAMAGTAMVAGLVRHRR